MSVSSSAARRFACACGILAMMLVSASALAWFLDIGRPGVLSEAMGLSVPGLFVDGGKSVEGRGDETVPPVFEEEVMPLSSCVDVRVAAEGRVVGFLSDERPEAEFALLSSMLRDRGWTSVSSGSELGGSFVKEGGTYIWAFVSCMGIGEGTSVVVNCLTADGEEGSQ